ncbi:hypothetical protein OOJ91_26710 [Micromonospora lupini]|uniref:hypothetical protein n=1 Tax=Micromonospora lupini TaxID=285679 RepID=UPI0022562389|nr:hypothetical protein [Micromonospora lupini]MCX5069443.1 hypothetical protein [Micromonospora lupini]
MTALAPSSWRLAWAERENDRRRRAYRDATAAWRRRQDHLVRLRIEAAGFLGCTQPRTGLPVDLDDDELVFRVVPVAELVEAEARHVAGLPTPGGCALAETADAALPAGLRVVDSGMAVVTSHRVAFAGREHRREWRYADLRGAAHHPDVPVTLLHDSARLCGLRVPASTAVNFRFYLTLAATEDRAAVTAQVDALLAAHQATPPVPLSPVAPVDAPLTAVRPDRRALAVATVATVVFATLGPGAVGSPDVGPVRRAEAATIAPSADSSAPTLSGELVMLDRGTPATANDASVGPPVPAPAVHPVVPARVPAARSAALAPRARSAGPAVPADPVASVAPVPSAPVPPTAPAPSVSATPTPDLTDQPTASLSPSPSPSPSEPAVTVTPQVSP